MFKQNYASIFSRRPAFLGGRFSHLTPISPTSVVKLPPKPQGSDPEPILTMPMPTSASPKYPPIQRNPPMRPTRQPRTP